VNAGERAFRDALGRVHLAVRRDSVSGKELLVLEAPLFDETWQDELTASAANTVFAVLGDEPTLERTLEVTRKAMDALSLLVTGLLARADGAKVACKAGCGHCCHVVVGVTAPEALTIFDHLKRSRSARELERLEARVVEFRERTRGLTSSERFSPEYPCVFLDDAGSCTIYEVRPFACRGMNSLDATECETRLQDPKARAEFAENGGGHVFVEPIRAFRAVSAGLQLCLAELYGLDLRPLELCAAMDVLFQSKASLLIGEWLGGGRPFEAAGCEQNGTLSGHASDAQNVSGGHCPP
jgi:Fe-S-cluster containining protein